MISVDYNECHLIDLRYIISIFGIALGAAISRISPIDPSATITAAVICFAACRARGGEHLVVNNPRHPRDVSAVFFSSRALDPISASFREQNARRTVGRFASEWEKMEIPYKDGDLPG
jgi:hypothetical protein